METNKETFTYFGVQQMSLLGHSIFLYYIYNKFDQLLLTYILVRIN